MFRGLGDLFKSNKQRMRERDREVRQALRKAERSVRSLDSEVARRENSGKEAWTQAREAKKSGEPGAVQRALVRYRASQLDIIKLEQKRFGAERAVDTMRMAKTNEELADSLQVLTMVLDIDPEKHDSVLAAVDEKRHELGEVDQPWVEEYERLMADTEGVMSDFVPSMEMLKEQLEDEVAEEVGSPQTETREGELTDKIEEGRARVRKLLEEDDQ